MKRLASANSRGHSVRRRQGQLATFAGANLNPLPIGTGIRKADHFGPRAMQRPIYSDMQFRSDGVSEDCLYLNIWTPAKSADAHLPVLVYFYGGGLTAGDGSEYRYDGENMAKLGIVALTVNYRLSVFGFLAHPELARESPHHASGNYGFLDQCAALEWVRKNIAAFGGDPKRVTIAGESAGSTSVSAQMASPLAKNLFAGAIGERAVRSWAHADAGIPRSGPRRESGLRSSPRTVVNAHNLADLRAMPAQKLLDATTAPDQYAPHFGTDIDGWFLPKNPVAIFRAGEQAHVPLLVGWNSEEGNYRLVLRRDAPTPENLEKAIHNLYGNHADAVWKTYGATTPEEAMQAATDLASDRFIAFSTWRWSDLQRKTGGKPVYRYYYSRPRPAIGGQAGFKTWDRRLAFGGNRIRHGQSAFEQSLCLDDG